MTSAPKRGPGRPPLPEAEARSARFLLRLRPDELAKLKKLAAGAKQSASDLIRSWISKGRLRR